MTIGLESGATKLSDAIYLDYFATTPCDPQVVEAMLPWFSHNVGNAHSVHEFGRQAARAVENARHSVAGLIGAQDREIVFTSGATEANNLAIKGAVRHLRRCGDSRRRVVTVATEHKCVLESVRALEEEGFEPVILEVGADGRLSAELLREALRVPTLLVSVMAANNETGVVQDIEGLSRLIREAGALFHVDMAQMAGKLPVSVGTVDLASLSAHKLYGPQGIGALFVRRRPRVRLAALFSGGGQERGLRSGTLPVPLIVGFGRAAELARERLASDAARLGALRDHLSLLLERSIPGCRINGAGAPRLPGALNICLPPGLPGNLPGGMTAQALRRNAPGVAFSSGSACSTESGAPSYVLRAMGLTADEARRSLRLSVGRFTSVEDIERAAALLSAAARNSNS